MSHKEALTIRSLADRSFWSNDSEDTTSVFLNDRELHDELAKIEELEKELSITY